MNVVEIPIDFFKKERNGYANWRTAICRELKQNSEDAGSTIIRADITSETRDSVEYTKLVFSDNGSGMSYEVLRNVYFALGRTTKGEGSTGGFGRARILTNFSMDHYEIRTRNLRAWGSGAHFQIEEVEEFVEGTVQTIFVDQTTPGVLENCLKTYLRECLHTDLSVYVNGVEFEFDAAPGAHIRDLYQNGAKFATVFYDKSGYKPNHLVVRVSGSSMFTKWVYAVPGTVTVELEPWNSRNILTSNRDGMKDEFRIILDKFVEELSTETRSALKPQITRKFELFRGNTGTIKHTRPRRMTSNVKVDGTMSRREIKDHTQVRKIQAPLVSVSGLSGLAFSSRPRIEEDRELEITHEEDRDSHDTFSVESQGRVMSVADFVPSVPMFFDTADETILRESVFWNPKVWNFTLKGDVADFGIWRSKLNLLFAWRAALEYMAEVALSLELSDEIEFLAGFCFCDELGMCWSMEDGRNALLINPLDDQGRPKFRLGEKMDMKKIIATARHEMAHAVGFDAHNEDFAGALSSLDAASDDAAIFQLMRKAIS